MQRSNFTQAASIYSTREISGRHGTGWVLLSCYALSYYITQANYKGTHFYKSIVVFNKSFSAGESSTSDYTLFLHEDLNGRKAGDVTSAFFKFFIASEEIHPVLWADNCFGQNKNWTFFTAFVLLVNTDWEPESITIIYLESGHTFMRADSVHGVIGKRMKATPEIVTFRDVVQLILML